MQKTNEIYYFGYMNIYWIEAEKLATKLEKKGISHFEKRRHQILLCDVLKNRMGLSTTTVCCSGRFSFARHEKMLRYQQLNASIETDRNAQCDAKRLKGMQTIANDTSAVDVCTIVDISFWLWVVRFLSIWRRKKKVQMSGNAIFSRYLALNCCVQLFTFMLDWLQRFEICVNLRAQELN